MDNQPNEVSSEHEDTYSETAADITPLRSEQVAKPNFELAQQPQPFSESVATAQPSVDTIKPMPFAASNPELADDEAPISPTPLSSIVPGPQKPNRKKWYYISGAAAAFILLVVVVLVYFLWYQKPEKVLSDAVGQFVTAKNMTFAGSLSTGGQDSMMALDYTGTVNGKSSAIDMTAKIDASGEKFSVPVSILGDAQQFYFKLSGLQDLEKKFITPYLSMYGVTGTQQTRLDTLVKAIDGQWYKVTPSDLSEDSTSQPKASCVSDQIEKIRTDPSTQKELLAIYRAHPLFVITKSLGTKNDSVGYQVDPVSDHDAKPFFKALSTSTFFKNLQKCDSSIKIDTSDFSNSTVGTNKATIQVWVNQWNHQLTNVSFDSNDPSSPAKLVFSPKVGDVKTVETPKNAKSVNDLKDEYQQLMTTLMGGDGQTPAN